MNNGADSRVIRMLSRLKKAALVLAAPERYAIYDNRRYAHHQLSFSQEGEDLVLDRLFEGQSTSGFFVDVGAHHPQRFSNTYRFYLRGWRGINIDPLPEGIRLFRELRPRDINIDCAISDSEGELTYYQFNEPALNGFSAELARERDGLRDYRLVAESRLRTRRLADVLDEHLPDGQQIDFLNVDVEGLDLQVLHSNDWGRYRPTVVLVEDLAGGSPQAGKSPTVAFMSAQGYSLRSRTVNTLFFCRSD